MFLGSSSLSVLSPLVRWLSLLPLGRRKGGKELAVCKAHAGFSLTFLGAVLTSCVSSLHRVHSS
jgi:hypothetical protein